MEMTRKESCETMSYPPGGHEEAQYSYNIMSHGVFSVNVKPYSFFVH